MSELPAKLSESVFFDANAASGESAVAAASAAVLRVSDLSRSNRGLLLPSDTYLANKVSPLIDVLMALQLMDEIEPKDRSTELRILKQQYRLRYQVQGMI
jgi:hypothetical protein